MLNVHYLASPDKEMTVGQLAMYQGRIYFEYDPAFLRTGIELSPFSLPLKAGALHAEPAPWGGLYGLFNDSLPDGWGLLLMDRHLRSKGIDTRYLTPLDRLAYMGHATMGALVYEPSTEEARDAFDIDISVMARGAIDIYAGHSSDVLPEIAQAGGSPAGARPKVLVHLCEEQMVSGEREAPEGFESWVIKFFAEPEGSNTGKIEYAYSLMAKAAGINMPETRLFQDNNGNAWFGIKRFDRCARERIHMHTLGGLIDADFRLPSLDYMDVLRVTQALTRNTEGVQAAFALMVFNVLAYNRDDHSKNFSYLMDSDGQWCLSPAYDLTCSSGINGEHTTAIAGEGRAPTEAHMFQVGETVGLKQVSMQRIVERVTASISRWGEWCEQADITSTIKFPPGM
ncbi:HIPA PROTEIN [hydrothermal vent metagenome]|uniref:HIPA PROTEIN n=1 Tax=hydrothermal vent metagenome TaxID=652676 RepID=A0A3B0XVN4_9ZZZZ